MYLRLKQNSELSLIVRTEGACEGLYRGPRVTDLVRSAITAWSMPGIIRDSRRSATYFPSVNARKILPMGIE